MSDILQFQSTMRAHDMAARLRAVFSRKVEERCGAFVSGCDAASPVVDVDIEPGLGADGFRIADGPAGEIRLSGGSSRGCLCGIGKLLRDSQYAEGRFIPGPWRGTSIPDKPVRGIYLATHFHNFFHDAPMEKVVHLHAGPGPLGIQPLDAFASIGTTTMGSMTRLPRRCSSD